MSLDQTPTRLVRVACDKASELAQRVALFAVVMRVREPAALLDGFGELIREDAQRMLITAKAWSSATRQARVSLEFGARSDLVDRVAAILREASPALRRAVWEELSPALQARFRPSSAVERPSPAMKSLAARLVHETTR